MLQPFREFHESYCRATEKVNKSFKFDFQVQLTTLSV